jgi:glycosyltransferase involved in cell wall biosynthesis
VITLFQVALFFIHPSRFVKIVPFLLKNRDKQLWYDFWMAVWVARQLPALGVDHLHAHAATSEAAVAMFAAILSGKSFSFTAHASDIFPRQEYLVKKLDEANFVAAISEYNRRYLMSHYGDESVGEKIHVVHCGVDLAQMAMNGHRPLTSARKFTILSIARLVEQKGHHVLIEALAMLKARGIDFTWVVVGSGPRQAILEELVKAKGLLAWVEFKGDQDSDKVMALLHQADLFVLPCLRTKNNMMDGIPVALMEAMAVGTPVVSTQLSGIPELIEDRVSGFLAPPDDAAALADILAGIIKTPGLLEPVKREARKRVERDFAADRNAGMIYRLFMEDQVKN